jgi:hypothetical protein
MSDDSAGVKPVVQTTPEAYGPHFYPHVLEQYKMAVQRAETTADRRESGNRLFFVASTSVAALYSIGFGGETDILLPLLGAYICVGWLTFIWARHRLNIATFIVIRELEEKLPARVFDGERERRYAGTPRRRQSSPVSWWELVMPLLFAMFFVLLLMDNLTEHGGIDPAL